MMLVFLRCMMNHVFQTVRSWWFATMTPAGSPMTTLAQRENMRKRRLFSLMPLFALILCLGYLGYLVCSGTITSFAFQIPIYSLQIVFMLLALWLNRQGYLKIASVTFYF